MDLISNLALAILWIIVTSHVSQNSSYWMINCMYGRNSRASLIQSYHLIIYICSSKFIQVLMWRVVVRATPIMSLIEIDGIKVTAWKIADFAKEVEFLDWNSASLKHDFQNIRAKVWYNYWNFLNLKCMSVQDIFKSLHHTASRPQHTKLVRISCACVRFKNRIRNWAGVRYKINKQKMCSSTHWNFS